MQNIFKFFIDFIYIINSKITSVGILVAISALLLALKGYKEKETEKRENLKQIKKSTLEGILKELDFLGQWFRTPYPNDFKGSGWGPYDMVFKTEGAEYTKFAVDPKYTFLYGNDFLNVLIMFNQLNTNFKQLIERDLIYSNSNPNLSNKAQKLLRSLEESDKKKFIEEIEMRDICSRSELSEEELFILNKQKMMRAVHTKGIGDKNNESSLHSLFCRLEGLARDEINSIGSDLRFEQAQFFKWVNYLNGVIYILIITIFLSIFYTK